MGDLRDMRESYERDGLDAADLAPTWLQQARRWLDDAVAAGLPEPNAMVLATAAADGAPSARTVLLKGLDERGLVLYTSYGSRKGTQARENPRAAIVFPWHPLQRQLLVRGAVEVVDAAESDAYFASRPRGSRLGAIASPQSQVVASRGELDERYAEAQARYAGRDDVPRPDGWGGLRVVPDAVEFWQGRVNRMHDRLCYRRDGDAWVVERLAP